MAKIKEMQPDLRPDEKMLKYGPKALSDAELLAIILRTGTCGMSSVDLAEHILTGTDGSHSVLNLFNHDLQELIKVPGIGRVKALQLLSISELSVRISKSTNKPGKRFNNPETIAGCYMEQMRHLKKEQVVLVMLNAACDFICDAVISTGTVNSSLLSPREIFIEAMKTEAVFIILLHNHPSGSVQPSENDKSSTKAVFEAGQTIGIQLLDHIIIGDRTYFSFKKEGLL